MSTEDTFKITYHLGTQKKINYVYVGNKGFFDVQQYISNWLFNELGYPRCSIRLFWIDGDDDEVDIVNENDYLYFFKNYPAHPKRIWHVHVASVEGRKDETVGAKTSQPSFNSTSNTPKISPADDSYEFAVHDHVECDGCLMAPIVGFRYKCIQCSNYDLCQNCESKHVHSEHMMVRMPHNNCPSVVESYITGRSVSRKHVKRAKASCPIVKNGLSIIIDDNGGEKSNVDSGENAEQPTTSNGKERAYGRKHHRRHQRHNFLANLYQMMHDLAEGGSAAAAVNANGENVSSSTKTTTTAAGPHATSATNTTTTANSKEFAGTGCAAEVIAAQIAAQKAHENALKAAEIASKVAHETAIQAAKTLTENMFTPTVPCAEQTDNNTNEKESTNDKVDATNTSPRDDGLNSVPILPLDTFAQFLDPQYMKTGVQILNNFSDMFARMLDPMDNEEANRQSCSNLRKSSTTSTKTSVSSNLNDMAGDAKELVKEKSIEKQQANDETHKEHKQPGSNASSNIEIEDIGSDSESDSISESFVKLSTPKSSSENISAQTTPPQSLNPTHVTDYSQVSANLRAYIAEEASKDANASIETGVAATEQVAAKSTNTTSSTKNEERRAVPVYHADEHINDSINAMMAMGFSNEGAWLTQLLESVNGNIPEALDLMSVAQRGGR